MEYRDALNTILMHGFGRNDVPTSEALYEHGFIGCLRPWTALRDENFKELLTAIMSLRPRPASIQFGKKRNSLSKST